MWLACATQEEIAEAVGVPRQTIDDWTKDFAESCLVKDSAFPPGFEPPIYNVWKQQTKSNASTLALEGKCKLEFAFENRSAICMSCSAHTRLHSNSALTQAMNWPWGSSSRGGLC